MHQQIVSLLTNVRTLITSDSFSTEFRLSNTAFTRERKISPESVVRFVLSCNKSCYDFDLEHFFQDSRLPHFSKAAMTKARSKLSFEAFHKIFDSSLQDLPFSQSWNQYQLLAVDGMVGELPKVKQLMENYHKNAPVPYPQFHAVSLYDVLNRFFVSASFQAAPAPERKIAAELIRKYQGPFPPLYLFDRGFPSLALIQQLKKEKRNYLFRVSGSFLSEVEQVRTSGPPDQLVSIHYDKRRAHDAKVQESDELTFPVDLEVRCVRVELSSKETELLITSLTPEEADVAQLKTLYGLRWGIETGHNYLKNAVFLETFTGILENSVKQEYYASLFQYNLSRLFAETAQKTVDAESKKKGDEICVSNQPDKDDSGSKGTALSFVDWNETDDKELGWLDSAKDPSVFKSDSSESDLQTKEND